MAQFHAPALANDIQNQDSTRYTVHLSPEFPVTKYPTDSDLSEDVIYGSSPTPSLTHYVPPTPSLTHYIPPPSLTVAKTHLTYPNNPSVCLTELLYRFRFDHPSRLWSAR